GCRSARASVGRPAPSWTAWRGRPSRSWRSGALSDSPQRARRGGGGAPPAALGSPGGAVAAAAAAPRSAAAAGAAAAPPQPGAVRARGSAVEKEATARRKLELIADMTRRLQDILKRVSDKSLPDETKEKYQALAQSIQAQMAALNRPAARA
ncbi:unnamed protein product, partial [Prorocentrum cordatum]